MGDQGFDPCECIYSHELAMRRLLRLLRGSQSYCTDNECYRDDVPRPDGAPDSALLISLFVIVAFLLYYFRPSSQRNSEGPTKNNGHGSNGAPPCPPPATS